jgi:hypothetical protein
MLPKRSAEDKKSQLGYNLVIYPAHSHYFLIFPRIIYPEVIDGKFDHEPEEPIDPIL